MKILSAIALSFSALMLVNTCLAKDIENNIHNDKINTATKSWQKTGHAALIKNGNGKITYPFDEKLPTLTCSPLHVCDIELEAGEKIRNVAIGDQVRWILSPATSGKSSNSTPHVIIKPTDENIATNMIITTDLRTYYLYLISKKTGYVTRVNFYYPHDLVQKWNDNEEIKKETQLNKIAEFPSITAVNLDFNYTIKGNGKHITPEKVFNDGKHVYIKMKEDISSKEMPVLMIVGKNNQAELVNYRVKNGYYIVDRLFDKAELILGVGRNQEKIIITRKSTKNCFFNCK